MLGFGITSIDLMGKKNNSLWPLVARYGDANWRHGDFKDVAYYFNWPLYEDIVMKGGLK